MDGRTLLDRDTFREATFARDRRRCVLCGAAAADAHHIMERRLFPDGGYYLDNGASVCEPCHLRCERTEVTVEDVRERCGITKPLLPPHLYHDHRYDKWGNVILQDGRRVPGELFTDPSVQKVLREGGALAQFVKHVKYPRTYHLPWSPGATDDDRVLDDVSCFDGREVVVTPKLDGENASLYDDHYHARSLEGRSHPSQDWLKNLHAQIRHEIPPTWRICGENLTARHAIGYADLPSYFIVFSIWDGMTCLAWEETEQYASVLGLHVMPALYRGPWVEHAVRACFDRAAMFGAEAAEGYVVRLSGSFAYRDFRASVAKYVRAGHADQAVQNWRNAPWTYNALAS